MMPLVQVSQGQGARHVECLDLGGHVLLNELSEDFRVSFDSVSLCKFHGREKIFPEVRRYLFDQSGKFSATGQVQKKSCASAPNGDDDDGIT